MQFVDVIGQDALSARLRDGVISGRIAHAQLLEGPKGSGGLALARAYAQYLHCADRTKEDSCGVCMSCLAHKKVQHPDLHWTFPFFKKDGAGKSISEPFQIPWRQLMLDSGYVGLEDWLVKIGADKKQLFIFKKMNSKMTLTQDAIVVAIGIIKNPTSLKKIILINIFNKTEAKEI